jgi:hypothetical protein
MVEEDEDESPHVNMDKTDEEAQDTCLALDNNLDSEVDDFTTMTSLLRRVTTNNLNTTQTLEYTKDRYNVKIRKRKGLSQGPTNNLCRPKDEINKMRKG